MDSPVLKTIPAAADQPELDLAARVMGPEVRLRRLTSTLLWAAQILLASLSCSLLPCPSSPGVGRMAQCRSSA